MESNEKSMGLWMVDKRRTAAELRQGGANDIHFTRSCIGVMCSGVSPVVPHQQVDYCEGTLTSQEPHPSY
jgi:hypothetical protein